MSQTERTYRVALSYQSDKSFLQLLDENLKEANYAHNSKRSRVISVRGAFAALLGTLFRENQNDELRPEGVTKYDSMHELYINMAVGNYATDTKVWGKFINSVATAIGYGDLPTNKEAETAYMLICEDYEDNNSYVKLEMRTAAEGIYNERQRIAEEAKAKANAAPAAAV